MDTEQRMMEFVKQLINNSIAASYPYHNFNHTLYVYERIIEIATQEQSSADALRLLKAAALWHDAGYINCYQGHEEEGCLLVQKYLPQFDFTANEIDVICGMIMATKIPQSPQNHLEKMIADADLAYLVGTDIESHAKELFEEMRMLNPDLKEELWNRTQIIFIEQHRYFTNYCRNTKEPVKTTYLNGLKLIW